VKSSTVVLVSTLCLVTSSCKKADPAAAGAASASPGQAAPAAAAGSLSGFEGDLTIAATSAKEKRPIPPFNVTVKGAKMRFELPEGMEGAPKLGRHSYAIVDAPAKKLYTVVDEQKMVMVMDLDKMGEQLKEMKAKTPGADTSSKTPPKITKTGHSDTVAGISCEDWDIVSAKGEKGRVCVSNESASFLSIPSLGLQSEDLWAKEVFDGQHLPLRMVSYDAAGTEENRLEVTKIERKPVDDSVFAVPAGYRTMDFSQLMAGVQGMLSGLGGNKPGSGMPPFPTAMPSGMAMPPGMAMPSNLALPPGMKLPKNAAELMQQIQERAKAAGIKPPPQ
jgi:hypothetical protein